MHLIYKQLPLYINLYIKKQHVFLLRNDDLCSIYTFQIKSSLIFFDITKETFYSIFHNRIFNYELKSMLFVNLGFDI